MGEIHGLAGEALQVGRPGLGMAAERFDPIVEVVQRDKQDVGRRISAGGASASKEYSRTGQGRGTQAHGLDEISPLKSVHGNGISFPE